MKKVELSSFNNSSYNPGNFIRRVLWYLINIIIFKCSLPFPSGFKFLLLGMFGCKIGSSSVIKPNVNIKYPWFLEIGDNSWIGENVWLDNLCEIKIGSNVCISQGAYLFTGNHNYKKTTFDLLTEPIILEDGAWIGAKAVVCPGVTLASHSVITAGSVVTKNTEPFKIYQGNPAEFIRVRKLS